MPRTQKDTKNRDKTKISNAFLFKNSKDRALEEKAHLHVYGKGVVCDTDSVGYKTPNNFSRLELVVDATEGFIPLWAKDSILRWRFQDRSLAIFQNPEEAKTKIRNLFGEAILAWESSAPVGFTERQDAWDFEIVVRADDRCNTNGCVLASAFFPDAGRHELVIYPKLFSQSQKEQVETLIHEIGHIFGLRHFFAQISETRWASELFGAHNEFSIMNYGPKSVLTDNDKSDLSLLYSRAWSGELSDINGTPIRLMRPWSHSRFRP